MPLAVEVRFKLERLGLGDNFTLCSRSGSHLVLSSYRLGASECESSRTDHPWWARSASGGVRPQLSLRVRVLGLNLLLVAGRLLVVQVVSSPAAASVGTTGILLVLRV